MQIFLMPPSDWENCRVSAAADCSLAPFFRVVSLGRRGEYARLIIPGKTDCFCLFLRRILYEAFGTEIFYSPGNISDSYSLRGRPPAGARGESRFVAHHAFAP